MQEISIIIQKFLSEKYPDSGIDFEEAGVIEISPAPATATVSGEAADFATNIAMKLAGRLHQNPRELAQAIVDHINTNPSYKAEIAGPGFINFVLSNNYWTNVINQVNQDINSLSEKAYAGKTVICEFSDPNPFKVLHVGHLYTSIVGESISRLVEFGGGHVIRANFGGDVGLHVGKTLWALIQQQIQPQDLTIEKIAACYVDGTNAYEDNETSKSKIVATNKTVYQIAAQLNNSGDMNKNLDHSYFEQSFPGNSYLAELYWTGRKLSYQYFEDFYARVGVKFAKYYPESTVASTGLEAVKSHTPSVYKESDGAIVFVGEDYGLHTRVFINKEGLPTYESKDVGLLLSKWADYSFDESIVITGNDIIDYMKVVLKSIEQYEPELVARTRHITHGNVRLPGNEKMSSRKGNFIRAVDVLDDVESLVSETTIAMAAIKYALLKYKIGGNIEFDAKKSVATTGDSGVYLQYSAVRAKKILANCTNTESTPNTEMSSHEKALIKKIAAYQTAIKEATTELAPHKICAYLYELAQEFSRFYENIKVAGNERESELAEVVKAYLTVMQHGLNLLGIETPEEM